MREIREIKFKAYFDGEMLYDAWRVDNALYWKKNGYQCFDLFAFKQENPAILLQYIGLEDGISREIYESDILKDDYNRILLVGWHRCSFAFKALTETNFAWACDIMQWFEGDTPRPRIIGNSYETPEMNGGVP